MMMNDTTKTTSVLLLLPVRVNTTTVVIVVVLIMMVLLIHVLLTGPKFVNRKKENLLKHVVITGGSSGIGLAVAKECIKGKAGRVTLIARNVQKLKEVQKQLLLENSNNNNNNTKVEVLSIDVSQEKDVEAILTEYFSREDVPLPTALFNVAGTSIASKIEDTPYETYRRLMDVNYHGTVNMTKCVLPFMKQNDGGGAIAVTSSAAGQCGVFGYTAYAPSKFALTGFVEALSMEVAPENISVTIAFPPDTDTPGFEEEQKHKPKETDLISEVAGLFQPEDIAKRLVASTFNGKTSVYWGLEGWMLSTLTAGMGPVNSFVDVLCQVFLMSLFRFISLFYLYSFRGIVSKCAKENKHKEDKCK